MKLLDQARTGSAGPRRGATLMLAMLVLFVLLMIVFQISISTGTDARVSRNEETLRAMDEAIESVLLQVYEDLKSDAEADAGGGGEGGGADAFGGGGGGEGEGGGGGGASDSREDAWAVPQRTELNEVRLRILIQDEDSKFNLLSILTENEEEAEKAFERLVRIIEFSRKGTTAEIDSGEARRIAEAMREFMQRREDQILPKPDLLSDDEEEEGIGLPLSLREFVGIDRDLFPADLFRDFRDERDDVVHSLGSFLTTWTSVATREDRDDRQAQAANPSAPPPEPEEQEGDEEGGEEGEGEAEGEGGEAGVPDPSQAPGGGGGGGSGQAGIAVNVNTAPPAVLKALLDDRDVPFDFWDAVIEYRNTEDEEAEENDEPPLDEYGEEITVKQYFSSIQELSEIDGWLEVDPIVQGELQNLLTVQSNVFSIIVTARRPTGVQGEGPPPGDRESLEREEHEGQGLVRTVRSVIWRRTLDDGTVQIVPIQRWEVLDYVPYEVLDYPEDER